jgi:multisubunit Na+/H+ antiporter MnhB subunit
MTLSLFDLTLAVILIGLAVGILTARDLFQGVVLFIVFGLLMAIAWSRLQAFDIALAEAAVGAGLTGALLLNYLSRLEGADNKTSMDREWWMRAGFVCGCGVLFALLLGRCLMAMSPPEQGLREMVLAQMPNSGVAHPITAVLLNFRAYDTLLEMGVLLVAVVAAWSCGTLPESRRMRAPSGPILEALVRSFSPLILLFAGYILWAGTGQPGGAFQAGAVLSASGVMVIVAGTFAPPTLHPFWQRLLLLLGLLTFLGIAIHPMLSGAPLLTYPVDSASLLILLLETTLMFSIALTLVCLFVGGPTTRELVSDQQPKVSK